MNIKNLTEDQILTMIDGNDLKMGGGGDRGRDSDRRRDSDRGRDRDRDHANTIEDILEDQVDPLGQTLDLYGNNVLFDE